MTHVQPSVHVPQVVSAHGIGGLAYGHPRLERPPAPQADESFKKETSQLKETVEQLKKELLQVKQDREEALMCIDAATDSLNSTEELKKQLEAIQEERDTLQTKFDTEVAAMSTKLIERQSAGLRERELEQKALEMKLNESKLHEEIERLKARIEERDQKVLRLKKDDEAVKHQLMDLNHKNGQLVGEIRTLKTYIDGWRKRYSELVDHVEDSRSLSSLPPIITPATPEPVSPPQSIDAPPAFQPAPRRSSLGNILSPASCPAIFVVPPTPIPDC